MPQPPALLCNREKGKRVNKDRATAGVVTTTEATSAAITAAAMVAATAAAAAAAAAEESVTAVADHTKYMQRCDVGADII